MALPSWPDDVHLVIGAGPTNQIIQVGIRFPMVLSSGVMGV